MVQVGHQGTNETITKKKKEKKKEKENKKEFFNGFPLHPTITLHLTKPAKIENGKNKRSSKIQMKWHYCSSQCHLAYLYLSPKYTVNVDNKNLKKHKKEREREREREVAMETMLVVKRSGCLSNRMK